MCVTQERRAGVGEETCAEGKFGKQWKDLSVTEYNSCPQITKAIGNKDSEIG